MTQPSLSEELMLILKSIAVLQGVPVREGRDTFGRPFLDIDVEGMRRLHALAVVRGHVEVAEHMRQMLARGERREMET